MTKRKSFIYFTFLASAIFIILSGCEREYLYEEEGCPEIGTFGNIMGRRTTLTIHARTNSSAIAKAKKIFIKRRENYINEADLIITGKFTPHKREIGNIEEVSPIPFRYKLYSSNRKITNETLSSSYWFSHPEYLGSGGDKSLSAFSDAQFGMSTSDICNLPFFLEYEKTTYQSIVGVQEIGLNSYNITMLFFDGKLYRIVLSSTSEFKAPISHINGIRNLRNVFWRAYGKPAFYSSIPYMQSANDKDNKFAALFETETNVDDINYPNKYVYEWHLPNKYIRLGYIESTPGESNTVATITSIDWIKMKKNEYLQMKEKEETSRKAEEADKEMRMRNSAKMFK